MAWTRLVYFLVLLSTDVIPGAHDPGQTWISDDLVGKMFSVMRDGAVRFRSDTLSNNTGLTVCLRMLHEQPDYSIELTFENQTGIVRLDAVSTIHNLQYNLYVSFNESVSFNKFDMVQSFGQLWPWKNRCFTWESSSGMAQVWFDGAMSIRKGVARGKVFSGPFELSLPFFEGQVSDVYIWGWALNVQHLHNFLSYNTIVPPGSILDWSLIQYNTSGYTVLEPTLVRPNSMKATKHKKQKSGQGLKRRGNKERDKGR